MRDSRSEALLPSRWSERTSQGFCDREASPLSDWRIPALYGGGATPGLPAIAL
jgi:hypothetical protein